MTTHSLFSQNEDRVIEFFEKYDKDVIKKAILNHLKLNPTDTVEHCKEYPKNSIKRHIGTEILNFYEVNPKSNKVSLVYSKGDKQYYRSIE
jgi:Mg/Co/Ni transporter MgtE